MRACRGSNSWARASILYCMKCPGMARESGVQNLDEGCRTMKRKVGGVLEELVTKQQVEGPSKNQHVRDDLPNSQLISALSQAGRPTVHRAIYSQ